MIDSGITTSLETARTHETPRTTRRVAPFAAGR